MTYSHHEEETIACPGCDLVQRVPHIRSGGKARCPRCGELVGIGRRDPIDLPLAFPITAAIAFLVANTMPLMSLHAVGREAQTTIIGGAYQMWLEGSQITAVIVAFCAVLAPGFQLLFLLVVLIAVRRPPAPMWVGGMLRSAHMVAPWSMTEVMLLGILVALVKIAQLAKVEAGIGMFAAGAFIGLIAAILVTFDADEIWKRVRWADGRDPPLLPTAADASGKAVR